MDLKSSALHPRKKLRLLQFASTTLPTWQIADPTWDPILPTRSLSKGYQRKLQRKNYPLCKNCGPYITLAQDLKTRSPLHQSRVGKNVNIKHAINLIYKYHCRSISELYDKCTNDEWAVFVYQNNPHFEKDINLALDLYVKDCLSLQRRNPWEWLISFQDFKIEEEYELLTWFCAQNINPERFVEAVHDVLNSKEFKKNSLKLWGISNSGKTFIARLLCKYFVCALVDNHASEQPFFFSNFLNKSIILIDELYVTSATCEAYKSILGGAPIDVDKKFNHKQLLQRTPVIITSNFKKFGRGHLPQIDEDAFETRCYMFNCDTIYKPKVTVTGPAFAHLMHWLSNKDMLCD